MVKIENLEGGQEKMKVEKVIHTNYWCDASV